MGRTRRLILAAMAVGLLVLPVTVAGATPATVTSGSFETLPGGTDLGYEVTGHATMVRVAGTDTTRVRVQVRGLDADQVYAVHVHNAPCDAMPPGGGHYQEEVGGAVDPVNEIWPTITTNSSGVGTGTAIHDHVAREDAQAIVIHWPENSAVRLACLDLG